MDCIFCKIIKGDIPSYTIYEDDIVKVFLDVNPMSPGHMLIIPKKHFENLDDIDIDTLTHINEIAKKMHILLKEKLNERGLSTIVEDTNLTEFITLNNWSYNNSYKASRIFLLDKKNTYPSLKYFIDIHRDSVNRETSTVKISNQNYARILFVVGLEHNKYQKNLDFTNKLNDISNKLYPGLSRGVLKKSGEGVDGIYNQDVNENVILIEIGGIDNNIEEVLNTINALCDILQRYIKE